MAILHDNLFTEGLSGKVGNLVFKISRKKSYVSQAPDFTKVISSPRQIYNRFRFSEAVRYAQSVKNLSGVELPFKVNKCQTVYNAAISYYMRNSEASPTYLSSQLVTSLAKMNETMLSGRQVKALMYVYTKGSITNSVYQVINDVSKATASRDLQQLLVKHFLYRHGTRGAGVEYKLSCAEGNS